MPQAALRDRDHDHLKHAWTFDISSREVDKLNDEQRGCGYPLLDFTAYASLATSVHASASAPAGSRIGHDGSVAAKPPNVRMLVGHCAFGSNDADLLLSLLPQFVFVRGQGRLTMLVELLNEEWHGDRPGRDVVVARLVEVLLIEALRCTAVPTAPPGLLRGLADDRLAAALRQIHGYPRKAWTVIDLAREAALSRSTFFERFKREVGIAPVEYLLSWRMALAKDLLGRGKAGLAEVAEQIGYSSASTFSTALIRSPAARPRCRAELRTVGKA